MNAALGRTPAAPPNWEVALERDMFGRLLESVRDYAIFMLEPDGTIASWNAGAQRLKGYSASEAIGRHFSMFYPASAVEAGWPQEELRRARAEGRMEDEGWRLRKDGSRFWANVVISPVWGDAGELLGFSKVTRDLTERKEHENRLAESERNLRLLIDGVQDYAIFALDPDGFITSWNQGAQRINGYTADEAIGRHFSIFYLPDSVAAGWPREELRRASALGRFEDEGWRARKDGTRLWANVVITAIRDTDGTLLGFSKVTRDLTDRMRMRELEDEGARIHQFIAMLSHELRNPLAPIGNAVRLLRHAGGSPEVHRCADMIGRQADHLAHLVDDLLDVSRVTSGKIPLKLAPIELNTLVALAAEAARSIMDERGHALSLVTAGKPVFVQADATRLTQVLSNLLSNAAQYTPPGGRVDVKLQAEGDVARLTVADNGAGMSELLMRRAFDPFVQGSRSLDRAIGGLGIGLTMVKRLVELHEGTVVAASAGEGRGSCFTVTLPLVADPPPGSTPPATGEGGRPIGSASRAVLIVDDNRDAADSLAELLRLDGHRVTIAHDGLAALESAPGMLPDTVLLDLGLPGMDGYEVARRMRSLPGLERVHLIAVTGYGQQSDHEATAQAGFDAHLVKPVDFAELERLLG